MMQTNLKLFATGNDLEPAPALARQSDPATSHVAACEFVQSGELASHENQIVWCSDTIGGDWTAHELAAYSATKLAKPLDSVQITRRLKGLREKQVLIELPARPCKCCGALMNTYESQRI